MMYKYHLHDVNWGAFSLSDIFEIETCKCSKVAALTEGKIPYIGATNRNNGVLSFVDGDSTLITKGNCMAFICDGEGSIGYSMYKKEDFIGSTTVKVGRNNKLNKFNAKFISTVADTIRSKYNFGFKRNEAHLKKEILQLPIDNENQPSWHFMEEYIKERENKQRQDLKEYYKNRLLDLVICPKVLTDVAWGEFLIKNIFTIEAVKGKPVKNYTRGTTPYVTTSSLNNGVTHFICANNKISKGKCISIDPIGGKTFYHEYEFIGRGGAGSAINLLYNKNLNKQIALFLCSAIEKTSLEKASYAIALNGDRLRNAKILLPIDENGNPNWLYMENFIKKIEQNQIKNILKRLNGYIYIYSGQ